MTRPLVLLTLLWAQTRALEITSLVVPPSVVNNSGPTVLDCQYTLTPDDLERQGSGLVVKWFFNNHPTPVYMWIPGRPQHRHAIGILRGRLDLDFRATDNNFTMYRALSIVNTTTELSGEYRCTVSTYIAEDSKTKKMVVYVPEKILDITHSKPSPDKVNISCQGFGLYPEPTIAMYKEPFTHGTSKPIEGVAVEVSSSAGRYDISASLVLQDEGLQSPTTFVCEVCIPSTDYCSTKRVTYNPGTPEHL